MMKNVLIIEDDGFYQDLLLDHFTKAGYNAEIVEDRGTAIRKIIDGCFDTVIVSVCNMNGLNGFSIIPIIHYIDPKVPIIGIWREVGRNRPFYLFLKPFDIKKVDDVLRNITIELQSQKELQAIEN